MNYGTTAVAETPKVGTGLPTPTLSRVREFVPSVYYFDSGRVLWTFMIVVGDVCVVASTRKTPESPLLTRETRRLVRSNFTP